MSVRLAYVNIFSSDPEGLSAFYMSMFGFSEIWTHRSPIYRCLDAGGVELGFNSELAYELLGVAQGRSEEAAPRVFVTFEMDSADAVEAAAAQIAQAGGRIVKAPYDTYYNARQAVFEDPEGNLFRLNFRKGPRKPSQDVENPPWVARNDPA